MDYDIRTHLLIATTNQGKLADFRELFHDLPIVPVNLTDLGIVTDVEETGDTFAANACLKARAYAQMSGLITLADDSGLEVAALNGAPGVLSARYGGPGLSDADRNNLLLANLAGTPFHDRLARFTCVIALATPDGDCETVEGHVGGVIDFAPRGTFGFGYDPIFFVIDRGKMMAELSPAEKNNISHRAVAAHRARPVIERWFAGS